MNAEEKERMKESRKKNASIYYTPSKSQDFNTILSI